MCAYSLVLVFSRFASCFLNNGDCGAEVHFLFILFLFLESLLFLLFTLCMLCDQLSSMKSNQTSIDRLKNQRHDVRVEVNEVCGSPLDTEFQFKWLVPVAVLFSDAIKEKVLGYRVTSGSNGEYCLQSSTGKEENVPLIERDNEGKSTEMKETKLEVSFPSVLSSNGSNRSIVESKENFNVSTFF